MAHSTLKHSFNEPKGQSSAVASLLYSRGGERHDVTKSGSYIYTGDAGTYHEWEFRTRLKIKAAGDDPDRYAEAMSKVVEGLRGEAFIVAKELGSAKICDVGNEEMDLEPGVEVLINALKRSVFPQTTHEAKELFRQYCKPSGCLQAEWRIDASIYFQKAKVLEIVDGTRLRVEPRRRASSRLAVGPCWTGQE